LSGLTFGACAYFLQVGIGYTRCIWAFTPALGVLALFSQLALYKRILSKETSRRK
jgi:hypothetical protein